MLSNLETEVWTDPRVDKVYLKVRGWDTKAGCKRGIIITFSEQMLEYLMEDVAEGEEYPQKRLEQWRDEIQLR